MSLFFRRIIIIHDFSVCCLRFAERQLRSPHAAHTVSPFFVRITCDKTKKQIASQYTRDHDKWWMLFVWCQIDLSVSLSPHTAPRQCLHNFTILVLCLSCKMLIFRMDIANSFVSLESHRYGLKGDLARSTQWFFFFNSENHHWIKLLYIYWTFLHTYIKCTDALNFSLLTLGQYAEDWIDFAFCACFPAGRRRFIRFVVVHTASRFVAHSFRLYASCRPRFVSRHNRITVQFLSFCFRFCFVHLLACLAPHTSSTRRLYCLCRFPHDRESPVCAARGRSQPSPFVFNGLAHVCGAFASIDERSIVVGCLRAIFVSRESQNNQTQCRRWERTKKMIIFLIFVRSNWMNGREQCRFTIDWARPAVSIEIDFREWPRYRDYANIFNALEKASPTPIYRVGKTAKKKLFLFFVAFSLIFLLPHRLTVNRMRKTEWFQW